LLNFTCN